MFWTLFRIWHGNLGTTKCGGGNLSNYMNVCQTIILNEFLAHSASYKLAISVNLINFLKFKIFKSVDGIQVKLN